MTREASIQGRDETATQPQDWLIFNPADLREVGSDFMNRVFENAEHRQMAVELRFAAAPKDSESSDMRLRGLAIFRFSPRRAWGKAELIAGTPREAAELDNAYEEEPDAVVTGSPRVSRGAMRLKWQRELGPCNRFTFPIPCQVELMYCAAAS